MGILKRWFGGPAAVRQLPAGTVTVNRQGKVVTSTVPSTVPPDLLESISADVLELFREARQQQMALTELTIYFGSLRVTARELRGGAIIFLFPQSVSLSHIQPVRP